MITKECTHCFEQLVVGRSSDYTGRRGDDIPVWFIDLDDKDHDTFEVEALESDKDTIEYDLCPSCTSKYTSSSYD